MSPDSERPVAAGLSVPNPRKSQRLHPAHISSVTKQDSEVLVVLQPNFWWYFKHLNWHEIYVSNN